MFKKYQGLFISLAVTGLFIFFMIYGLNHNASFNPSSLYGKPAPRFEASLDGGALFSSANVVGRGSHWTVVNFWTSSCFVCRSEAPELQVFYTQAEKKILPKVQFLSVNIQDPQEEIQQWKNNYHLTFPVILDKAGIISVSFGVTGTPETFFIDPKGTVRYRIAGEVNAHQISSFLSWLDQHPQASEADATQALL